LPILILIVAIAFGVLGLALAGFRQGVQDRELANQHRAEILYNRGEVYLQCGQYQLAEAHFQEALRLWPNNPDAAEYLALAKAKQTVTPSPTPPPPTSTPVVPTPTPEIVVVPLTDVLYEEGQEHYESGDWENAIAKLEQLRLQDINYRANEVVQMLFDSHKALGIALDQAGQIEAAILQYDRALDLRPRNPEVSGLRRRADLYQSALNDWDVDWESVVNFLIALYHLAPEYQDTADRLYEASLTYGEELIKQERYCPASQIFEQAVQIRDDDEEVVKRQADTEYLCQVTAPPLLETPTPDGPGSTWNDVHIGTLFATCHDPHNDRYDICAQNAVDNVLQTWIEQAEQPAITLDGRLLAYRSSDPAHPGLYAMDVISGTQLTITVAADAHYPTWSPDGTKVAFTQYDPEKEDWFIYIASPGTDIPLSRIRNGEWPSWGPNGLLAFTTCSGQNDCGIYVYNPKTQAIQRVTASKQDRAAAWSPSGEEIAYMSDVGLSFNLYVVTIESAGVRQITKNLFTDVLPIWSPDGQRIAFITNHDDNWSVYSVHPWPGKGQAEPITSLGAESADWQRLGLAWTASVVRPPGE
jgi:tetratricopeptide (TPR) repeat protein